MWNPEHRIAADRSETGAEWATATVIAVCTENLIRIDCVAESPNVNGDDRAALP